MPGAGGRRGTKKIPQRRRGRRGNAENKKAKERCRGAGPLRRRGLSSTNLIESCLSTVRHVARSLKRGESGDDVARWTAAGLLEAEKKFRKVKGYRELKGLAGKLHPQLHSQVQMT